MIWLQNYDPFGSAWLSTLVASLPVVWLLTAIAFLGIRIHLASLSALVLALAIAIFGFGMPHRSALAAAGYGAAFGLFPIGWIILNLLFLYQMTVDKGLFSVLKTSLTQISPDPRIQVILIAFSFGAFFEGAAGFGTPVAVTSAILIGMGFKPLQASGLSLIANTAPVAFGALGTPVIALEKVTGIELEKLSSMIGRQLPFFSLIVPFWVVWAMCGLRKTLEIWPAALTAGLAFAIPQFLVSNFHGPWLVDIVASLVSIVALIVLLRFWSPAPFSLGTTPPRPLDLNPPPHAPSPSELVVPSRQLLWKAWMPWLLLTVFVFAWGTPALKRSVEKLSNPKFEIPHLHKLVVRTPPAAVPNAKADDAVFTLSWISATGTGILLAAVVAGFIMGFTPLSAARLYGRTIWNVRHSLLTIAAMLALGYVTKFSGADTTLGLALAKTGSFYPFFGTLLGWLGVALTGSDTASNVLFGSLQVTTAKQTGIDPVLMAAANSSGGVMGKMVDAQSIVVASTATGWYGHEGQILRFVFFHSIALAALVGILVTCQAKLWPFNTWVP